LPTQTKPYVVLLAPLSVNPVLVGVLIAGAVLPGILACAVAEHW
jgi:hypothetical protein